MLSVLYFRKTVFNETNHNAYWWDIAHVTSRQYEQEQSKNKEQRVSFRRIVKICVYIIFFSIVLTSAVLSKLSLFTMINAYKIQEQVCYDYESNRMCISINRISIVAKSIYCAMANASNYCYGYTILFNISP